MKRFVHHLFTTRLAREEGGSVYILTGLVIFFLIGVTGIGIDLGFQQLVRQKLQQSSDMAALAAGSLAINDNATTTQQQQAAARFFALNFPASYLGVNRPSPNISIASGSITVSSAGNTIPTQFGRMLDINTMTANASTRIDVSQQTTAQSYDLQLVIDVSGSMFIQDTGVSGLSRMGAAINAATTVTNNLLQPNISNSRVGLISWSEQVYGQTALNANAAPILSAIASLSAIGPATGSVAGLQAAEADIPNMRTSAVRAVVLLTDGSNNVSTSPNFWGTNRVNTASLASCTRLKNEGIQVFTIAFGGDVLAACNVYYHCPLNANSYAQCSIRAVPNTSSTYCPRPFLRECASSPANYFEAPNAATLNAAFASILTTIKSLRIVE